METKFFFTCLDSGGGIRCGYSDSSGCDFTSFPKSSTPAGEMIKLTEKYGLALTQCYINAYMNVI